MTARRQTKSSVIDKMPLVDTQEEEQSVRSNGHAKKDTDDRSFLTRTREGSVHYFDGNNIPLPDDVTVSGIYLKRLGKYIPMLTGIIEVVPTSEYGRHVRQNSITIQVSSPALPGDCHTSLTITRKPKEKEDYSKLDGFVITPSSTNEYDIAWKALKVLSIKARASCPESFPEYVDTLGWMNNMCVSVNGAIDSRGVITDKKVVVAAPSDWPQRIPDNHASLPYIIHANTLELLYDFWPREKTLFATALLGACSFIMNPAHDGTARWNLEIAGQTDWYKTTGINHFFHLFMGNGYKHDTPTQLFGGGNKKSDEDSGAGRRGSLNKLRYHAYMDYDHSVHPGQDGYEYQQKERIGKLKSFGNSDRAPAKAD